MADITTDRFVTLSVPPGGSPHLLTTRYDGAYTQLNLRSERQYQPTPASWQRLTNLLQTQEPSRGRLWDDGIVGLTYRVPKTH